MVIVGIVVMWCALVGCAHAWNVTSWGGVKRLPNEVPINIGFAHDDHEEMFEFRYGAPANYMYNVCMARFHPTHTREMCEEFVDKVYDAWFGVHYAPGLYFNIPIAFEDNRADRGTVLSLIGDRFQYQSYLEIGTHQDDIFRMARVKFPVAVGVDPVSGGTHRMTSDEFFAANMQTFDMIFIDGLHEAYQVHRDVMNALHILNEGGTIVMHDCNPHGFLHLRAVYPLPPENFPYWNGDTWKAVVALRLLDYVEIIVVDVDHGVGVVRKRPNNRPLSAQWIEFLGNDPISKLSNDILATSRTELLRLATVDGLEVWLDQEVQNVL
jgi:hypothetical protein